MTRLQVVFFGSPQFAVPSLVAVAQVHEVVAVVTQPDRPAGRGGKLQPPAVKEVAMQLGLPVLQPAKLRDGTFTPRIAALHPDVLVVVAYGRILPPDLLAVPTLGAWNVHASILPKFRGAAPIQWAIIQGEHSTGVAIMRMEDGLDTGPVAAQTSELIRGDDTAETLSLRLAPLGAELLIETLTKIARGVVELREQNKEAATLAPMMRKEDGHLDFRQPASLVSLRARGVSPWPGATVFLEGVPTKVFLPTLVPARGSPGEILGLTSHGLIVACADQAIGFAELQMPGRRRMSAQSFLAGHPLKPGTRLGLSSS